MKSQKYYIERVKDILEEVKGKYKVKSVYIFGSIAKNEFHENSDLDLLIDFSEILSLFEIADLQFLLEYELKIKVDLVTFDKTEISFLNSLKEGLIKIEI